MRFGRMAGVCAVAPLVAFSWVASPASGQTARESGRGDTPRALAPDARERASGVIVKVERVGDEAAKGASTKKGSESARGASRRLTINTAAVWRDWARDQAQTTDTGAAGKDAKAGKNSVATRGEPADRNTVVVIDVVPDTTVETRFRAPDDETDAGSKTPPAADSGKGKAGGRAAAKPVRFHADDLKPGLFVEVDFRHVSARNPARTVTVIRPVIRPEEDAKPGK